MTRLIIYGDFNCPFSALASVRADRLMAGGAYDVEWRAVQHDPAIPVDGEPVKGDLAAGLTDEVAKVVDLGRDVGFQLAVPTVRSNTASASAALAATIGDDAHQLRRRLFAAVWAEDRNVGAGDLAEVAATDRDEVVAGRWQAEFDALPQPVTPSLVLPDGYLSRGLGALARLADLVAGGR